MSESHSDAHGDETPRRTSSVKADINVTPLVDVVLVLLIIFMVVTPQMEAGVQVDLPPAKNPDAESKGLEPTTLSVGKDGKIYLDKDPIALAELERHLKELHEEKPETPLVLKADKAAAYGKVRNLFKTCQSIGFPGVSLQVIDKGDARSNGSELEPWPSTSVVVARAACSRR